MVGKYNIVIKAGRVTFNLIIRRNITIIRGASAIGKTQLLKAISNFNRYGRSSGIIIDSAVKLDIAESEIIGAINQLKSNENTIIFYEENLEYVKSIEFADAVCKSDNYVVIIGRDDLPNLPYSIKEIKTLKTKNNNGIFETNLTELHNINKIERIFKPDVILTEDEGSGNDFFTMISDIPCIPAHGNGNVINVLSTLKNYENILVIVDGAAFGALYNNTIQYIFKDTRRIIIWSPESFEYLILQSGAVLHEKLNLYLDKTYDYADSTKFKSWERYYTWLLNDLCQYNKIGNYSKSSLNDFFKRKQIIDKIVDKFPIELIFRDKGK